MQLLIRGGLMLSAPWLLANRVAAQDEVTAPASRSLADVAVAESVTQRARPEYDAVGINVAGFQLFPSLQLGTAFDDNIDDVATNSSADAYFTIAPKIIAQSNWPTNKLTVSASGQFDQFATHGNENSSQYNIATDGVLDVSAATAINLSGAYGRDVEPRGSFGDIYGVGQRIRYDLGTGHLSISTQLADVALTAAATFSDYRYLSVNINGQSLSQSYRDRNELSGLLRADYTLSPIVRLFVSGAVNTADYQQQIPSFDQNSHGYAVLGGFAFGITELISGEIGVGYLRQFYQQAGLLSIGGFSYSGKLTWNATTLTSVNATAARTIQQSPFVAPSGILQDSIGLGIDHELFRNLIISTSGSFEADDYSGLDRLDRLWVVEGGVRYLSQRWLEAALTVDHRFQSTTSPSGRRYADSSILFSITFKR